MHWQLGARGSTAIPAWVTRSASRKFSSAPESTRASRGRDCCPQRRTPTLTGEPSPLSQGTGGEKVSGEGEELGERNGLPRPLHRHANIKRGRQSEEPPVYGYCCNTTTTRTNTHIFKLLLPLPLLYTTTTRLLLNYYLHFN